MPTKTAAQKKVEDKISAPKQKKEVRGAALKEKRPATSGRRVASRKAPAKTEVCSCRSECKPEEAFWVHHGPVVSSVAELMEALVDMSDEQYEYHTKRSGNDFAAWLRDCFGKEALASRIETAMTRTKAVQALRSPCCK